MATAKRQRGEGVRTTRVRLDRDFVVVIKPDEDATYRNTVDILDEMKINVAKRYALVDISPVESQLIAKTEGR